MKVVVLALSLVTSISFAAQKNHRRTEAATKEKPIEYCQLMKNKEMEMEIISSNIENVNTTNTPEGGPYKAKKLVCHEKMCAVLSYKNVVSKLLPGHPDADASGHVKFPDIDLQAEMRSMIDARSIYEIAARNCKAKRVM